MPQKAAEAGVDGLIAVAAGAGGHAGTWSPFALVAEIRQFFDKTLLLAGCLNHGHEMLAAQLLGADLAYMGTRFIATVRARHRTPTNRCSSAPRRRHHPHPSGIRHPGQLLRQSLEQAGYDMAALTSSHEAGKLKPLDEEAKAWKTVWSAGQGVGEINDLPSAAA
jgi:nitronate monooxygenase